MSQLDAALAALAALHRDLHHRWLNPWWAKFEIVFGVTGIAVAIVFGNDSPGTVVPCINRITAWPRTWPG